MASLPLLPSLYDKSSQKPKEGGEGSELEPQNKKLLSVDHFSDDCNNPNHDSGFRTAPSSPKHPSTSEDSSTQTSPPPSPRFWQQPNIIDPFSETILKGRDALPSHHLLKIESFSSLSKALMEKYSSEFEAGGYKWTFSIYPTGDKSKEGEDHISMYLEIAKTSSLPTGWEVNAIFNFFIFDQIRDKYVGFQDAKVRRFHCMKSEWGVVKFIDLQTFNNPSNGYLVNDTCSFGVETFIVKTTSKVERLLMIKNPLTCSVAWTFDSLSRKPLNRYESSSFVGGDYKWKIVFYPSGCQSNEKSNNISSVGLALDSTLPPDTRLFVRFVLRMRDQKKGNHFERTDSKMFSSTALIRGFAEFMSLTKLKDPDNGFLVGDTCIIEVELKVLGLVTLD